MNIDTNRLTAIVETAKAKTTDSRWINAIDKAYEQLATNPYIDIDGDGLLIAGGSDIYHANGSCQCDAYKYRRPCWHRAAVWWIRSRWRRS